MNARQTASPPDEGSRFASWSRRRAAVALVLVVGAISLGVLTGGRTGDTSTWNTAAAKDWSHSDEGLYKAIIQRVRDGEGYYPAAVEEQTLRNYPVQPAVTVREPGITYLGVLLGGARGLYWAMFAVGAVMIVALMWRLESLSPGKNTWRVAVLLSGLFSAAVFKPEYSVDTEVWAAMFIVLALVCRSLRSFWPSVGLGLLACLARELALPILAVMAFCAWREGKRREAAAWVGSSVVFLAVYAVHIVQVLSVTGTGDPKSQGWITFGGVPFVLETVRHSSALVVAPVWLTAVIVPLAVLGWLSRNSPFADRVVTFLAVYFLVFMVIGRMQNTYWGTLYVPLVGAGLAFSASGLMDLIRVARTPRPALRTIESSH